MPTDQDDGKHIKSAIGYELLVQDVMTKGVITVSKFDPVIKVADILNEKSISGLPVVDKERRVIGIITQVDILSMIGVSREHTFKDLLKHMLGESLPARKLGDHVGDIMTTPVFSIHPTANIAEAVRVMSEKKIRRLTVANDDKVLIGIVTRADILKAVINKIRS